MRAGSREKRSWPGGRSFALLVVTLGLALLTLRLASSMAAPAPLPVLDTLGGEFRLSSTRGGELSSADLTGRIVLLNFGYTACPEVCPTVLARLRAVLLDLEAVGITVQPLFVTLDPGRDDLARLSRYVAHFHPNLVGLRGTPEQTAAAAAHYRVFYQRDETDPGGEYALMHSVHIYLIDGAGRVRATFGGSVPVPEMVATVRRLAAGEQASWLN